MRTFIFTGTVRELRDYLKKWQQNNRPAGTESAITLGFK
ncbi:hypothetical protein Amet_2394 [Alkaliphilus metalliredigens QYMF]|uniref:Uncharacterized protein n=1 Tax=Alkaliphilus metalliredigens (strain QYMF) TaxID=293826 RepID=A6TQT0_ALKMQ|nr:hypothetical protein Amet_2394 [Alkaliphilus metalliredigens QYMF]